MSCESDDEPVQPRVSDDESSFRAGVFDFSRVGQRFEDPEYVETDAMSTDTEPSSPPPTSSPARLDISVLHHSMSSISTPSGQIDSPTPFSKLFLPSDDDAGDNTYRPASPQQPHSPGPGSTRAPRRTLEEKVKEVLAHMRSVDPRLSIRQLLTTLFTSEDPHLKLVANVFLSSDGPIELLGTWERRLPTSQQPALANWAIDKASEVCAYHASLLTDRANPGPFEAEAAYLRMSAKTGVTIERMQQFSMEKLGNVLDRTMGPFQRILSAVIGKEVAGKVVGKRVRNTRHVRTLVTSIVLNLRSREVNLLQHILGASAWRLQVPRRLAEVMNQFCIFPSYSSTVRLVKSLGKDGVQLVRLAVDSNLWAELMEYDNYNWQRIIHEALAGRTNIQHDQVSAIWILLNLPAGVVANDVLNVQKFKLLLGARHRIPGPTSLTQILPSNDDEIQFWTNSSIHIATMLVEHCPALASLAGDLPKFVDPNAIPPNCTKQFYLPTLDQEQGTVKGNIAVLEQYFTDILKIPKRRFEERMVAVLGDRLTTARDRSAQEQRALDRSTLRADRLSSIVILPGLMHTRLALMDVFNRHLWSGGQGTQDDPTDLGVLHSLLPHLTRVKHRKIDFYAWLRFLDVVLASLALSATGHILDPETEFKTLEDLTDHLKKTIQTPEQLMELSKNIVSSFLSSSINRLEAKKVKKLSGETISGHAVLLFQSLMVLRELTHSIKHGHPNRIVRCLKYLYPMFYAGASYNYSAEVGEFLHNVVHDWPKESVLPLVGALLVNTTGRSDGFKETDLNGEHYNRRIKQRAKGSNMTPKVLGDIAPALGWLGELNERLFPELGAEYQNTRHARVKTTEDVNTLAAHLLAKRVFDFHRDRKSERTIPDLYIRGCDLLAHGGHQRHLERHQLAMRTRDDKTPLETLGNTNENTYTEENEEESRESIVGMEYEIGSDLEDDYLDDGQQSEED